MSKHKPKKRIIRSLKLIEISGVDVPAQEGAQVMLMKRNDIEIHKHNVLVLLTSEEAGHTHSIWIESGQPGGNTGLAVIPHDDTFSHDHPWIIDSEGNIIIGANKGHGHIVDAKQVSEAFISMTASQLVDELAIMLNKRQFSSKERKKLASKGKALPDGSFPIVSKVDLQNAIQAFGRAKNKAEVAKHILKCASTLKAMDILPDEGILADLIKKNETGVNNGPSKIGKKEEQSMSDPKETDTTVKALQAQLVVVKVIAGLTDVEKTYYEDLSEIDKKGFLSKSAEMRSLDIETLAKAAKEADPVMYKTMDGIDLRKSAGPALIALAKSNDVLRKQNEDLLTKAEQKAYEKRAETELEYLPGTVEERAETLKALDAIKDEDIRKAAIASLHAGDAAMKASFQTIGHRTAKLESGSVGDEMQKGANVFHKSDPELSSEQAMSKFLKTPEGEALYLKTIN